MFFTGSKTNALSDVRILGPNDLDAQAYRRDAAESASETSEPDGLLFAVAVNGDGFCFDLQGNGPEKPVVHFNHETDTFEPFAENFAAAVRRFVEQV